MTARTKELYDVGDDVRVTASFVDDAGTPYDVSTTVCEVTSPSGVVSTPAVTHPGTGEYTAIVRVTEAGSWSQKWTATNGTFQQVQKKRFLARA